jgi:putative ABC transport system substrate-binding protein
MSPVMASKRLELLREAVPDLRRVAILLPEDNPANVEEARQGQEAAATLGLGPFSIPIRSAEDILPAFEGLKERADALYVGANPLILSNIVRISILAVGARLPTIYSSREYVQGGGLLAYGPDFAAIYRRAGDFFDKILRGVKPGDIPVEQPTKFDLVINLTEAQRTSRELVRRPQPDIGRMEIPQRSEPLTLIVANRLCCHPASGNTGVARGQYGGPSPA